MVLPGLGADTSFFGVCQLMFFFLKFFTNSAIKQREITHGS